MDLMLGLILHFLSLSPQSLKSLLLPEQVTSIEKGKGFIPSAQKCVVVRNHNSHKVLIMALY